MTGGDIGAALAAHDAFLDRLLAVPEPWEARLSPDGRWLACIWWGLGPAKELWLVQTDGRAPPRRLGDPRWDCAWLHWTPDSRAVVYGRSREGDERVGLRLVGLDGSERGLTPDRPGYYINGGELGPDGRTLVYAANLDPASGAEIEPSLIYRQDIATGERRALVRPARAIFAAPQLSPDGRHILYRRNDLDPAGTQLWLVDIEGRFDREIVNVGAQAKAEGSWSPEGGAVLVTAEAGGHRRIGLLRLAGDQIGTTRTTSIDWLVDDPRRPVMQAFWPPGSAEIVVEELHDTRPAAFLLDPATKRERAFSGGAEQLLPIGPLAQDLGGGTWLARRFGARHPSSFVILKPGATGRILGEIPRPPGSRLPRPEELVPAEDFRWTSDDGLAIQGWLYRAVPQSPGGGVRGTILLIHGGPTWHYSDELMAEPQYLAQMGFNLLLPNYRGSTGFSLAFQEAIKIDGWGGREQADIRSGAEALIRAGIAEPGRIGITGTSYGGYSAFWAITHFPPEIVAAAAPICGMTDLAVDHQTTRPDHRPYSEEMMGGSPESVPERYFERSPINFVAGIRGRLLIVQGATDPNVTPRNLADMCRRLDVNGIAHEVLVFEDEGHGIHRPANRKILYWRLAAFFADAFG
jgi:dipeptidyl aminopeptidase/acylaminoacyl peptidase